MLFRRDALDGVRTGAVTLAFRRWRRPSVWPESTLLTPVGQLDIRSIAVVALADITEEDAVRACDLCVLVGLEKEEFKRNVRKLKNLGLTESLGTGYRLSPRGEALLAAARAEPEASIDSSPWDS